MVLHLTMSSILNGPNGLSAGENVDRFVEDDVLIRKDVVIQNWKKQDHVVEDEAARINLEGHIGRINLYNHKQENGSILCGKRNYQKNLRANYEKIMHFILNGPNGPGVVISAQLPEQKSATLKHCVV